MKKIITLILAATLFLCIKFGQTNKSDVCVKIYYADKGLRTLVPIEYNPKSADIQKQANEIISQINAGLKSDRILQLIPDDVRIKDFKISGNNICIDIPAKISKTLPKNAETERLFVYQLVNSLTSIDGIDSVSFTIDGKKEQNFLGFLNMYEIFIPDYRI